MIVGYALSKGTLWYLAECSFLRRVEVVKVILRLPGTQKYNTRGRDHLPVVLKLPFFTLTWKPESVHTQDVLRNA